ncbi:MAG: DUF4091 domain-containing protein [Alphaproteobacteria bacterium]|nr:DUF4091 domain-containing protein [Alphaproteobacteria bacterium]
MTRSFYLLAALLLGTVAIAVAVGRADTLPEDSPALLHPVERIAYSDDWRLNTTREARPGEAVFVILRTGQDRCATITADRSGITYWQMLPMDLPVGSDENTAPGRFHEILAPRNQATCHLSRYVLAEWRVDGPSTVTLRHGGSGLVVRVENRAGPPPSRPFFIGLDNRGLLTAHCGGYCKREAELGRAYAALLIDHGLQPIRNWVVLPPVRKGLLDLDHGQSSGYSFRQMVLGSALYGEIGFPRAKLYQDPERYLRALERTVRSMGLVGRAWIYAADEPGDLDALRKELLLYDELAPSVRIMVTTPPDPRLNGLVDIHAPVYNTLIEGDDGGPNFWSYVSCMGSCGPNRAVRPHVEKTPGADTGEPDLLIDRPAGRLFRFFQEAEKRDLGAALYYAATEGYRLIPHGIDPFQDPWNFGGNGDGLLVFPGRPGMYGLKSDRPLPSFRLKLIRHAIQSYW